jgi:hypothetical protein
MPACFNCRIEVPAEAKRCYSCGAVYVRGTWKVPLWGVSTRREGWGLSSKVIGSTFFRAFVLLTPLWAPLLSSMLLDGDANAQALLLVLFVFLPGLHLISKLSRWSVLMKLIASVGYVGVMGVLGFLVLRQFTGIH